MRSMCGRYSLAVPGDIVAELFALVGSPEISPRWNIAPTQSVGVIRAAPDGARHLSPLRWGLVPTWAKDAKIGNRMINARSETAASKPSFRNALRRRRCIVPADGFYEWRRTVDGKVPTRIQRRDGTPMALAGLWERWSRGPEPLETFTILTTTPNHLLRPIHDRMPVILAPDDWQRWLDPDQQDARVVEPLMIPYPDGELEAFAVSTRVNSPRHDDPECAAPVA